MSESTEELYPYRLVAEFEWAGDGHPRIWMSNMLAMAVNEERIFDFDIVTVLRGNWTVLIIFTVDVMLHPVPYEQTKALGHALLTEFFRDSIEVRWSSPLLPVEVEA